jgi:pyroglutamyl-peptidase
VRILLTGFGPFGSVRNNPSARIVEHFEKVGVPGHELTTAVLPVSYRGASEEIVRRLDVERFDLVLLLGVAAGSEKVRLELFGRNRSSTVKKDAEELVSEGQVKPQGPLALSGTISARGVVRRLSEEGIPARISRSAGDYVCNHTYYAALHAAASGGRGARCLFVHLPCDEKTMEPGREYPCMPLETQIRAVELILAAAITRAGRT